MKIKDYVYITKENIKQLNSALTLLNNKKIENKSRLKLKKAELLKKVSELEFISKLKTADLLSDLRYFKPGFFGRIKIRMSGKSFVRCIIHMDNSNDVVRFFPIYRNNVVDINNEYYMFSPDSFRFINGIPTLYFYQGVPYSILHKPRELVPTFDAKAFSSIQRSKFITDALEGETPKLSGVVVWIVLIISVLNLIGLFIFAIMILDKLPK